MEAWTHANLDGPSTSMTNIKVEKSSTAQFNKGRGQLIGAGPANTAVPLCPTKEPKCHDCDACSVEQ